MASVTVSTKGQVVLPVEVRRKLGIVPGMRLELELSPDGGAAVLRPARRGGRVSRAKEGVASCPTRPER
jgi:AbrB family looped-hinge helix DNA binding protein